MLLLVVFPLKKKLFRTARESRKEARWFKRFHKGLAKPWYFIQLCGRLHACGALRPSARLPFASCWMRRLAPSRRAESLWPRFKCTELSKFGLTYCSMIPREQPVDGTLDRRPAACSEWTRTLPRLRPTCPPRPLGGGFEPPHGPTSKDPA